MALEGGDSTDEIINDIDEKTSLNSKQLDILIRINYFAEYGDMKRLMFARDIYADISKNKHLKKIKASRWGIPIKICLQYSEKETETMYRNTDMRAVMKWAVNNATIPQSTPWEIIANQTELLGYVEYIDPKLDWRYACVTQVNDKYSPKVVLYCIKNGKMSTMKVHKKKPWKSKDVLQTWGNLQLKTGDVIYIASCKREPAMKKVDDSWVKDYGNMEWWLNDYALVHRLDYISET